MQAVLDFAPDRLHQRWARIHMVGIGINVPKASLFFMEDQACHSPKQTYQSP